ncbi:MAG: hypothetical protein QF552_11505 [Litorilituus sp.]|jgi:hypothetical protein|nr:hypothetical protein [Litorilituus sp.]
MKMIKLTLILTILLITSPSFAHAGHDHTSMMASLMHLIWLAPAILVACILYSKLLTKNYHIKINKSQVKEKNHVL